MKLLLDENISRRHAAHLRTQGYDAVANTEIGLSGAEDTAVRAFAIQEGRTLVTLDADFGNIIRFPPNGTPGVIWLRIYPVTEHHIAETLDRILPLLAAIDMRNKLAVVDEDKIRVRR